MARWLNEDAYDGIIRPIASEYGVPVALIKAIIAKESGFRPAAYRAEVAINDASRGLMQILLGTAKGEGYGGVGGDASKLTGLFDPATNIEYGTSYLASRLRTTGGDVRGAISAYNGGYRPELGFGKVATKPLRLCLARDNAGNCIQYRNVAVGEYGNQPYVNDVLANLAYFESKERTPPTVIAPTTPAGSPPPLDGGNRYANESQTDCRDCGNGAWSFGTQIRKAITALCKFLFPKR